MRMIRFYLVHFLLLFLIFWMKIDPIDASSFIDIKNDIDPKGNLSSKEKFQVKHAFNRLLQSGSNITW